MHSSDCYTYVDTVRSKDSTYWVIPAVLKVPYVCPAKTNVGWKSYQPIVFSLKMRHWAPL